jgi:hypothetical protein
MSTGNYQTQWQDYCKHELLLLEPLLLKLGYTLVVDQPHLKGERFLQQAITTASGKKFILYGSTHDGKKVVIKATRDENGKKEMEHEHKCRLFLKEIDFAATVLHTPEERVFIVQEDFLISIQNFIEQPTTFLQRPVSEQFQFALKAFKAQEGAHATTYKHHKKIGSVYEIRTELVYRTHVSQFAKELKEGLPTKIDLHTLFETAKDILTEHKKTIEQYGNFLTHTDFVPHNFRIDASNTMYLLDHSSLAFGNKYECWARFLNFMTLYNRDLENALTQYVHDNRSLGEQKSLWLMRIYRLCEITLYYYNATKRSDGNLLLLNTARINFWSTVLKYMIEELPVPATVITDYELLRDSLRSEDEKERQKNLH